MCFLTHPNNHVSNASQTQSPNGGWSSPLFRVTRSVFLDVGMANQLTFKFSNKLACHPTSGSMPRNHPAATRHTDHTAPPLALLRPPRTPTNRHTPSVSTLCHAHAPRRQIPQDGCEPHRRTKRTKRTRYDTTPPHATLVHHATPTTPNSCTVPLQQNVGRVSQNPRRSSLVAHEPKKEEAVCAKSRGQGQKQKKNTAPQQCNTATLQHCNTATLQAHTAAPQFKQFKQSTIYQFIQLTLSQSTDPDRSASPHSANRPYNHRTQHKSLKRSPPSISQWLDCPLGCPLDCPLGYPMGCSMGCRLDSPHDFVVWCGAVLC
jgi:hypothetical protein